LFRGLMVLLAIILWIELANSCCTEEGRSTTSPKTQQPFRIKAILKGCGRSPPEKGSDIDGLGGLLDRYIA